MTGCEIMQCTDYKDGKCTNELDYVSKIDGSPMCPRNDNAILREEDEIEMKLELAFAPDGKFSGIVIGDRLIEDGEVVGYIKQKQEEIERLRERIYDQAVIISKLFPCATIDESGRGGKMTQTYTPVQGMIICASGGDFMKTADHLAEISKKDEEISELKGQIGVERENNEGWVAEIKKEKERVESLETALEITSGALEGSQGVVRELEERVKELELKIDVLIKDKNVALRLYLNKLNPSANRMKELEEIIAIQNDTIVNSEIRINEAEDTIKKLNEIIEAMRK